MANLKISRNETRARIKKSVCMRNEFSIRIKGLDSRGFSVPAMPTRNSEEPNMIIIIYKIKVMFSPSILISPSLASSSRIGSNRAYLIPAAALNRPCSIWPPCSDSIQRIRSRGDCDGLSLLALSSPEMPPTLLLISNFAMYCD